MSTFFKTDRDHERQEQVARHMEGVWGWTFHVHNDLAAINYHATNSQGQTVADIEVKCRTRPHRTFLTEYFRMIKYEQLMKSARDTSRAAFFVCAYPDRTICWANVERIDASHPVLKGRRPRPGSTHDLEWVVEVPIKQMRRIEWPGFADA